MKPSPSFVGRSIRRHGSEHWRMNLKLRSSNLSLRSLEYSEQTSSTVVVATQVCPNLMYCTVAFSSRCWPIVLQNSFLGCVQIFPGALVRSLENYVGGHINSLISNRLPFS